KSSDPQFTVVSDHAMKAKDSLQLNVDFTPANEGPQSADITVASNDPNEPVQVIHVTGNGSKDVLPSTEWPQASRARGDNGCGCRTTPAPSGYAAFGAVGVALAAMLRRRRR